MNAARIAELLQPFLQADPRDRSAGVLPSAPSAKPLSFRAGFSPEESAVLSQPQLENISHYIDLLLLWNARINLTAVREPEAIVIRHFGESLFAARHLFPNGAANEHLIDFGSGAGFPGLPIKIWAPNIRLTLIEANQRKATFLREVVRALTLSNAEVFSGRAEGFNSQAEVVALRAVEQFEQAVPIAARLLQPRGRLALLIGQAQVEKAKSLTPGFRWDPPIEVPLSSNRALLIGESVSDRENQNRHESC
jgi:16S rRNA (guanine527-N7)-methyltransferase